MTRYNPTKNYQVDGFLPDISNEMLALSMGIKLNDLLKNKSFNNFNSREKELTKNTLQAFHKAGLSTGVSTESYHTAVSQEGILDSIKALAKKIIQWFRSAGAWVKNHYNNFMNRFRQGKESVKTRAEELREKIKNIESDKIEFVIHDNYLDLLGRNIFIKDDIEEMLDVNKSLFIELSQTYHTTRISTEVPSRDVILVLENRNNDVFEEALRFIKNKDRSKLLKGKIYVLFDTISLVDKPGGLGNQLVIENSTLKESTKKVTYELTKAELESFIDFHEELLDRSEKDLAELKRQIDRANDGFFKVAKEAEDMLRNNEYDNEDDFLRLTMEKEAMDFILGYHKLAYKICAYPAQIINRLEIKG